MSRRSTNTTRSVRSRRPGRADHARDPHHRIPTRPPTCTCSSCPSRHEVHDSPPPASNRSRRGAFSCGSSQSHRDQYESLLLRMMQRQGEAHWGASSTRSCRVCDSHHCAPESMTDGNDGDEEDPDYDESQSIPVSSVGPIRSSRGGVLPPQKYIFNSRQNVEQAINSIALASLHGKAKGILRHLRMKSISTNSSHDDDNVIREKPEKRIARKKRPRGDPVGSSLPFRCGWTFHGKRECVSDTCDHTTCSLGLKTSASPSPPPPPAAAAGAAASQRKKRRSRHRRRIVRESTGGGGFCCRHPSTLAVGHCDDCGAICKHCLPILRGIRIQRKYLCHQHQYQEDEVGDIWDLCVGCATVALDRQEMDRLGQSCVVEEGGDVAGSQGREREEEEEELQLPQKRENKCIVQ